MPLGAAGHAARGCEGRGAGAVPGAAGGQARRGGEPQVPPPRAPHLHQARNASCALVVMCYKLRTSGDVL